MIDERGARCRRRHTTRRANERTSERDRQRESDNEISRYRGAMWHGGQSKQIMRQSQARYLLAGAGACAVCILERACVRRRATRLRRANTARERHKRQQWRQETTGKGATSGERATRDAESYSNIRVPLHKLAAALRAPFSGSRALVIAFRLALWWSLSCVWLGRLVRSEASRLAVYGVGCRCV